MADRDLGESDLACDLGGQLLVLRVPVGVHEDDRDGAESGIELRLQVPADDGFIGGCLDLAIGPHALVDFHHGAVEQFRLDDFLGEDVGPRLIANRQRIAEAARRHEQCSLALAFEESIGRNRGAHLDRTDRAGRDRLALLQLQEFPDPLDGSIPVGLRILREELVRDQRTIRPAPDDVGERAAAIDPEIPLAAGHDEPLVDCFSLTNTFRR
nr:hypothetical protein RFYW14_00003 [Pseudorhizobium flavum]